MAFLAPAEECWHAGSPGAISGAAHPRAAQNTCTVPPRHAPPRHPHQGRALGFSAGPRGVQKFRSSPSVATHLLSASLSCSEGLFVLAYVQPRRSSNLVAWKQWDGVQPVPEGCPPQKPHGNSRAPSCQEPVACADSPQSHLVAGPGSVTLIRLPAVTGVPAGLDVTLTLSLSLAVMSEQVSVLQGYFQERPNQPGPDFNIFLLLIPRVLISALEHQ